MRLNESRKFIDPDEVKPQADVAALLPMVTSLVPRTWHGLRGPDLDCIPAEHTLDMQFCKVEGEVKVPEMLRIDLGLERIC